MIVGASGIVDLFEEVAERLLISRRQADVDGQLVGFGKIVERSQMKSRYGTRHMAGQTM